MHGEQSWVRGRRYAEGIIDGTLRRRGILRSRMPTHFHRSACLPKQAKAGMTAS